MALLEVSGVSKRFGGIQALAEVSFAVEPGRVTALIGPNGAGKTTLFHIIGGFLGADEGLVRFDGRPIGRLAPHRVSRLGIARTFQDLKLFKRLTVLDNILLGVPREPRERLGRAVWGRDDSQLRAARRERALGILRLLDLRESPETRADNLSYGDQKLLAMARLLATDARLLLLDEPVSGLPVTMIDGLLRIIRRLVDEGRTILLVDHNMEAVMGIADQVVVLDHGRVIAEGSPRDVQANPTVVTTYLGKGAPT